MPNFLLIILAIIFPPLAVAIKAGLKPKLLPFFINLILYLVAAAFAIVGHPLSALFIILAIAHAIRVICTSD